MHPFGRRLENMARMIPQAITPEMREKYNVPHSEVKVFEELSRLPDSYVCVWSVPWADNELRHRTGEADFLILHPNYPLTVLEVKGGRLSCWHGKWQRLVNEVPQPADSPINQAYKSREALVHKFLSMPGFNSKEFLPSAAITVLTDTSRSSLAGDPGFYNYVLTTEDFAAFQQRLEKTMATPHVNLNRNGTGIGRHRVELLFQYFSRTPSFQVPLRSLLELDNAVIERLNTDHYLTLNQLASERHVLVNGGAGTGKTVLAVQKAIREAQAGRRTLLMCFNDNLAAHFKREVEKCPQSVRELLTASNYHDLCRKICEAENLIPDGEKKNPSAFFENLQNHTDYLVENGCTGNLSFDSIVVDEAQDFKKAWWKVVDNLRSHISQGHFWVFRDESQNVQHGEPFPLSGFFTFHLLRNFRNSREVFKLIANSQLSKFIEGTISVGPQGAECHLIEVSSADDVRRQLTARIKKLVEHEKVRPEDIVVLTGKGLSNPDNALISQTQINGIPLVREPLLKGPYILLDSVRRFKGLENKYIILTEIDEKDENKFRENEKLVYVGASRAISALTVFAGRETLARLGLKTGEELSQAG